MGAAVADKRQRDAGDGQHADGHANILDYVSKEHGHNPHDNQPAKAIHGEVRQIQHAQHQQKICNDHTDAADKPKGFAHSGKNKVRPVLGHVVQLA